MLESNSNRMVKKIKFCQQQTHERERTHRPTHSPQPTGRENPLLPHPPPAVEEEMAAASTPPAPNPPPSPPQKGRGKVVIVMGATGAGKSRLAVDLAAHFAGVEVVSADSMQVYRGLDVLTNKVPLHEQKGPPHSTYSPT